MSHPVRVFICQMNVAVLRLVWPNDSGLCSPSPLSFCLFALFYTCSVFFSCLFLPIAPYFAGMAVVGDVHFGTQVGFSRLANRMTMARTMKLYKLPDNTNSASELLQAQRRRLLNHL